MLLSGQEERGLTVGEHSSTIEMSLGCGRLGRERWTTASLVTFKVFCCKEVQRICIITGVKDIF